MARTNKHRSGRFNLKIDPLIAQALSDAGIHGDASADFPDLATWRQEVADYGRKISSMPTPYDKDVTISDRMIPAGDIKSEIRIRMYHPSNTVAPAPVLLWMHGGGMMGGSPEQDDGQMKQIAAKGNILVVSVDYRLAPEYPFPVPLQDCYDALMWVVLNIGEFGGDPQRLAVGGASAGGGLAAALALKVKGTGGPYLLHQSLTYPMLDSRNNTASSREIVSLGLWDRAYNKYAWKAYLGKAGEENNVPELASPSGAIDLSGLPPAFIAVGSLDLFRDENIAYANRLMEAGVTTSLHFYAGAVHGFDWYIPDEKMTEDFLDKRIAALKTALLVRI